MDANNRHNTPLVKTATLQMASETTATVAEAEVQTRQLARRHYENFSVVSLLLPRDLRQDFCNIYAFCRVADDLGDETGDRNVSLRLLADFRRQTLECFDGRASTAVFVALSGTIRRRDLPAQPFLDLIDAFEQDQRVFRYATFGEVLDYCRRSANPVGRLVLYLCGYRDERRQLLSDQTCSALQLANFWQDVRRDILERDRIYLPADSMERFGVTEAQIVEGRCDENFRRLMRYEVDRASEMFKRGEELLPLLRPAVRMQISLFGKGGRLVLSSIRRQHYDTMSRRPALSRWQKGGLIATALAGMAGRVLVGGRKDAGAAGESA
jgi:squalene synthase HpnC